MLFRAINLALCQLYPIYLTFKAVGRRSPRHEALVLRHLAGLSVYVASESIADRLLSWLPFYYFFKLIIVLWMALPETQGSVWVYRHLIHPLIRRHEPEIDRFLGRVDAALQQAAITAKNEAAGVGRELIQTAASRARQLILDGSIGQFTTAPPAAPPTIMPTTPTLVDNALEEEEEWDDEEMEAPTTVTTRARTAMTKRSSRRKSTSLKRSSRPQARPTAQAPPATKSIDENAVEQTKPAVVHQQHRPRRAILGDRNAL